MSTKKSRLGRGIDALIPASGLDKLLPAAESNNIEKTDVGQPLYLNISWISNNPDQPRQNFNEKELASLSQSIKAKGIIEPLVAIKIAEKQFEIIAGERRLRAAKMAGLDKVPVIIRKISEEPADRLEVALIENICREDLNPIEEAESFARLEKEFGKTHQEIAQMTGRERPTITNAVRLLKLPDFIKDDVRYKRLSAGHGRSLLALQDVTLLNQIRSEVITKNLTVRQTEALIKKLNKSPKSSLSYDSNDLIYFEALAKAFSQQLGGLKVSINHSSKNKKMEIFYKNNEELELLMKKIGLNPI